ncbi:60S ribosomal protein L6-1 [Morella rubra]|uniref:60S ribosomal protein L6-1 n=1 Tax=Morella rubra TaxID=262757 RepID=A0A6A1VJ89_9ROSI|nr:60S ribosomal protein L6-1 [Morella rubra]KAB1212901.1 60S ribosomal protein L6-1 [Morella rubra]
MYHKMGLWAIKAKNGRAFPSHEAKPKTLTPAEKPPKYYPFEDIKKPLLNKWKPQPTKLREPSSRHVASDCCSIKSAVIRSMCTGLAFPCELILIEDDDEAVEEEMLMQRSMLMVHTRREILVGH